MGYLVMIRYSTKEVSDERVETDEEPCRAFERDTTYADCCGFWDQLKNELVVRRRYY
jgi:hypothetical protein